VKTISAGLQTILAGNQFLVAELYSFTLIDGTVLRYGDYEPALPVLSANGHDYPAGGLKFTRTRARQALGLEVGELDLEIFADPDDSTSHVNGVSFQEFVRGGGLDGALVRVDRCFMSIWGDCATNGTLPWIVDSRFSVSVLGRTTIKPTVKDLTELLNITMPRDVYQPGCLNTLYDLDTCTLVKSSFKVLGAVTAGSTASLIKTDVTSHPSVFTLGTIKFTSGTNDGLVRTVKNHFDNGLSIGQLTVSLPLLAAPAVGDTFEAYPGCDKTQATCLAKFSNLANFRGQPFIPVPETAR
jgi:uncharacterized phage protein (TIGR02218 family)